jgi:hypothetical protein
VLSAMRRNAPTICEGERSSKLQKLMRASSERNARSRKNLLSRIEIRLRFPPRAEFFRPTLLIFFSLACRFFLDIDD